MMILKIIGTNYEWRTHGRGEALARLSGRNRPERSLFLCGILSEIKDSFIYKYD